MLKFYNLFKPREILKKTIDLAVNAEALSLEIQTRAHDKIAKRNDEIIISRDITGLLVRSNSLRRDNIENLLCTTAAKMDMTPSGPEFVKKLETSFEKNPNFLSSFLDSVKNISNTEVLQYWSAILKGELEVPGQMPLAIINILQKFDKDTAILFEKVWQFRCNHWMFYDMNDDFPITFTELGQLIQCDLVLPMLFGQHAAIQLDKNGWGSFESLVI